MTDIEQIQPPSVPASMIELSKLLADEIQQISGVNEELLGSATDDKAGVLSMLRQGAGLTTLQTLFDQLDYSQKTLGRLFMSLIQANFSPGKIKKITGEEPAQQFYSKAFGKYDVAIEEGTDTPTQRQMQFQQLIALKELGVSISNKVLIEASTLQNKKELVEADEAQLQIQQMQLDIAMEAEKAKIKDLESRAEANAGLGLERSSRVQENRALAIERLAEAERDRDAGTLDRVKAMKELEDMDIGQIEKLLRLSQYLKGQRSAQEVEDEAQVQTPNVEELAVMAEGEKNG